MGVHQFNITNRGWYVAYRLLGTLHARSVAVMAGVEAFVPTQLAQHWGACITSADLTQWLQVGRFDGRAVQPAGIAHMSEATRLGDECELTPLVGTPTGAWFLDFGQNLASTPTGLLISGRPRKDFGTMTVNLTKGGKVDLVKEAGGTLTRIQVGLGWDTRQTAGDAYDLDASVIALNASGVSPGAPWFVFYGNLKAPGDAIVHHGDNLTGTGTGDDEQISVNLAAIPDDITELMIAVTIYEAAKRSGQSFALVNNAFVRVSDESTGTELARYDLTEDTAPGVNCLVFAKVYRHGGTWNLKAIGDGFTNELQGLVDTYKIA